MNKIRVTSCLILSLQIIQILIGITGMAFGLVMNVASNDFLLYAVIMTPYWTGIPVILHI